MNAFEIKMFLIMGLILLTNSTFAQTMEDEQLKANIQRKSCFIQTSRSRAISSSASPGTYHVITAISLEHMDGYSRNAAITDRILRLTEAAVNFTFDDICSRYTSHHAQVPADFCQTLQALSFSMFGGDLNTTQMTFETHMMNTLSCLHRAKSFLMNDRSIANDVERRFATLISPRIRSYQLHLPRLVTGHCQLPEGSSSAQAEGTVREGLLLLTGVSREMGRLMSLADW